MYLVILILKLKLVQRNSCPISGNSDLEHLYTFKDMPVFMGCTEQNFGKDIKTDMKWWINKRMA